MPSVNKDFLSLGQRKVRAAPDFAAVNRYLYDPLLRVRPRPRLALDGANCRFEARKFVLHIE